MNHVREEKKRRAESQNRGEEFQKRIAEPQKRGFSYSNQKFRAGELQSRNPFILPPMAQGLTQRSQRDD